MRKPIIAGNWKMNKTAAEAVALINDLKPLVAKSYFPIDFHDAASFLKVRFLPKEKQSQQLRLPKRFYQ